MCILFEERDFKLDPYEFVRGRTICMTLSKIKLSNYAPEYKDTMVEGCQNRYPQTMTGAGSARFETAHSQRHVTAFIRR